VTASVVPPAPAHKPAAGGHWSWDGGTAVTVASGETVDSIARRHGVPAAAIMEANHLASPNAIQVGQRLVIPRYIPPLTGANTVAVLPAHPAPSTAKAASAPPPVAPAPAAAASPAGHAAAPGSSEVHVVAAGDTLSKIARHYGKSVPEIVKANNIQPNAKLNVGDRILIPGARIGHAKTEGEAASAMAAKPETKEVAAVVTTSPEAVNPIVSSKPAAETAPGLRWPVHGKVIAAFGSRSNGQPNDGIDVAVPENTPVKAADDGVVAYAGNELKGYGNLVLVRHPSGYVTAYAHAKELLVKKGDPIKRGQVIAKSGQTGNVEVPELHFEVRKGTAPMDPMPFLGGA
jgi:murein DD-endopeptidase MepM/ murein hydrolase activator NlpD